MAKIKSTLSMAGRVVVNRQPRSLNLESLVNLSSDSRTRALSTMTTLSTRMDTCSRSSSSGGRRRLSSGAKHGQRAATKRKQSSSQLLGRYDERDSLEHHGRPESRTTLSSGSTKIGEIKDGHRSKKSGVNYSGYTTYPQTRYLPRLDSRAERRTKMVGTGLFRSILCRRSVS